MKIEFKKATPGHVPGIMHIIQQGQAFFAGQGIPQWQNGYPSEALILEDIQKGYAYVLLANGQVAGTAALIFGAEPSYAKLHGGNWLQNSNQYAVVHRMGVEEEEKGSGLAGLLLAGLEEVAREAGAPAVRVDTHRKNIAMQKFLQKHGYTQRGVVYLTTHCLDDDVERIAFEKLLG